MIRVLVVDDSPLARKLILDALHADPGITVAGVFANAEIALWKLESLLPELIIMDLDRKEKQVRIQIELSLKAGARNKVSAAAQGFCSWS